MKYKLHTSDLRIVLLLLIPLAPFITHFILINYVYGWSVFNYVPHLYNDEVAYWHQIFTFSTVGFNGGYYSPNEITPLIEAVHYDAHGPMFPMLFGAVASVTGWEFYSGLFYNGVLFAIALYIYARGMSLSGLLLTCVLIVTFHPIFIYIGSIFQESLHQSIAIVFAALFSRLITERENFTYIIIIGVLIFIAGLLRYSWTILYIPLFFYTLSSRPIKSQLFGLAFACCLIILNIYVGSLIAPSGSAMELRELQNSQQGIYTSLAHLVNNFNGNIAKLTSGKNPIGLLIALQAIIIILIISLIKVVDISKQIVKYRSNAMFHICNLLPVTFAVLVFNSTLDRIVSPHLLLSLLIALRNGPRLIVGLVIVTNIFAIPSLLKEYRNWWENNYIANPNEFALKQHNMEEIIQYDANAKNPWCNTILISIKDYNGRVLGIPAGIGISYTHPLMDPLILPPKSKYILGEKLADKIGENHLNLISTLPAGKIYINKESACNN